MANTPDTNPRLESFVTRAATAAGAAAIVLGVISELAPSPFLENNGPVYFGFGLILLGLVGYIKISNWWARRHRDQGTGAKQ